MDKNLECTLIAAGAIESSCIMRFKFYLIKHKKLQISFKMCCRINILPNVYINNGGKMISRYKFYITKGNGRQYTASYPYEIAVCVSKLAERKLKVCGKLLYVIFSIH